MDLRWARRAQMVWEAAAQVFCLCCSEFCSEIVLMQCVVLCM